MARPRSIDDETLLDSLKSTFLELGPGASTQELARRAGVSEGTLFKRYGTKRRLFAAAMRLPEIEELPAFQNMLERAGEGSLEARLVELGLCLHEYLSSLLPLVQMIAANGKLTPRDFRGLLGTDEQAPPFVARAAFRALFEREMELGRLRRTDPEVLAMLFVGPVVHDCHLRIHFPDVMQDEPEAFVRRFVRTFLDLAASS